MPHQPRIALALLTGIVLALSACATGPDLDLTVHESDRGAVYLERIPDRSFQTAHPMTLPADTMARVLRGVVIKEGRGSLGYLSPGKPAAGRVFAEEEVEYLTPLLTEGLKRAASDQQVGFRIVQSSTKTAAPPAGPVFCLSDVRFPGVCESEQAGGSAIEESTEGTVYVYGQSLYLTLTGYRHRTERTGPENMAARRILNPTGLANHTVHFVPESAKRPDSYRTVRSTDTTMVIDYTLLAAMPVAPEMRPTPLHSPTPVKGEPGQRDADMDELRKELLGIKKKLAEQEEERARSLPSSSKKSAPR
ncbi:MAG: hypothetical protein E8D46_02555 [Nitrospira sp.]|nr:MAG: hypothetical protein E8D46_02555 [Nitrospira sp.]